jgi:hypothetical protein
MHAFMKRVFLLDVHVCMTVVVSFSQQLSTYSPYKLVNDEILSWAVILFGVEIFKGSLKLSVFVKWLYHIKLYCSALCQTVLQI